MGWLIAHMSELIPVRRLRETDKLLAFYHPAPAYPVHILIIPKAKITGLFDIRGEHGGFLLESFYTAQSLVEELDLSETGYRLVLNGGGYQEFPHLHFHLISGEPTQHDR